MIKWKRQIVNFFYNWKIIWSKPHKNFFWKNLCDLSTFYFWFFGILSFLVFLHVIYCFLFFFPFSYCGQYILAFSLYFFLCTMNMGFSSTFLFAKYSKSHSFYSKLKNPFPCHEVYWVHGANPIFCIDHLTLIRWCGQYHADHLYFP